MGFEVWHQGLYLFVIGNIRLISKAVKPGFHEYPSVRVPQLTVAMSTPDMRIFGGRYKNQWHVSGGEDLSKVKSQLRFSMILNEEDTGAHICPTTRALAGRDTNCVKKSWACYLAHSPKLPCVYRKLGLVIPME